MITVAVVATAFCAAAPPPDADASDWVRDADGRRMRVGFDPGSRAYLGVAWSPTAAGTELALGASMFELGWLTRTRQDDASGVSWKLEHALFLAELGFGSGSARELPLEATLYEGRFVRWSRDGALTIPTTPPTRLSIPFDLGAHVVVGRARTTPRDPAHVFAIDAVRAELVLDFWRTRAVGSAFGLEFGADYHLRIPRADGDDGSVVHRVAPFTEGALHFHHEWDLGKGLVDLRVEGGTAWTSAGRWASWAGATAAWEVVVLAINDAPLSLRIAGRWRFETPSAASDAPHVLEASVGLRFAPVAF